MATRRPLVRISGRNAELPVADDLPGSVPTGGTAGQVLTKQSAANYETAWVTPSGGGLTAAQARTIARRQALRYSTR